MIAAQIQERVEEASNLEEVAMTMTSLRQDTGVTRDLSSSVAPPPTDGGARRCGRPAEGRR
jgi:hypothetical protein